MFPNFDAKKSLRIVVPPCLEPAATLLFRTGGVIGGSAGSSSGATTNVFNTMVKGVLSDGFLAGCPDVEGNPADTVSPVNETDYYAFIDDDFVKPFLFQTFRPPTDSEMFPPGYDAAAAARKVMAVNNKITISEATQFASTRVDTTFRNIGAQADEYTIRTETFLASARWRGNLIYGPWFLGWRIKPNGGA